MHMTASETVHRRRQHDFPFAQGVRCITVVGNSLWERIKNLGPVISRPEGSPCLYNFLEREDDCKHL
jgi:hypothetical protein